MNALIAFSHYLIAVEGMAAVAGIITWQKWKHTYIRWFIVYLCAISFLGVCNLFLLPLNKKYDVSIINQIAVPFEILFINWFFYKTLNNKRRAVTIAGTLVYCSAWIIEKTEISMKGYYFDSLSYTIANLFILIYLILFFVEFVQSEKLLHFKQEAAFWIASGMLLFYLGTFPFYGLYNELAKNINLFIALAWGATALNYGMYILFSIGLTWGKPR